MAGVLVERQLSASSRSSVRFTLASEEHDGAIRRLLRENPMHGEVSLSFEREPNYFFSKELAGGRDQTILAFEGQRLLCMGRCSTRSRYVNGQLRRVAYLSELRLDSQARSRFDILRRGYQFFGQIQSDDPPELCFTSIAADNDRARRFLERGLPGMPAYKFIAGFTTFLIPVPRPSQLGPSERLGVSSVSATMARWSDLVAFLNAHGKEHQLASHWTVDDLYSLANFGLSLADVQVVVEDGQIIACGGLWDQRCFRQTVVRGYRTKIGRGRHLINLSATLFGTPRLPEIGSVLAVGILCPFAVRTTGERVLLPLLESLLFVGARRGLEFIALGFADDDHRLAIIRKRFRCREYRTRLYEVQWGERAEAISKAHPCLPEIALL